MRMPNKNELMPLAWTAGTLVALAILGVILTDTSASGMFSLAFAIFAYLVLPGYAIMLNFHFDALERIIIGMIISSAIVPAILYSANLFGAPVSRLVVLIAIVLIVVAAIAYRKKPD